LRSWPSSAPLLIVLSYPSCLVVAAVSAVLLPVVWRQPGWRVKALFAAYNVTAFAAFLGRTSWSGSLSIDREERF